MQYLIQKYFFENLKTLVQMTNDMVIKSIDPLINKYTIHSL